MDDMAAETLDILDDLLLQRLVNTHAGRACHDSRYGAD